MAGDWIKMRGNLWDDPRVARLCDLTDQTEAAIVGGLYWLWATADQHTEDGFMPGLTLRQIDRKTGIKGLGAALVEIGWLLDNDTEGVTLSSFADHNGASAKRRAADAQRKASVRSVSASDADNLPTNAGQIAPDCGARERDREEIEKEKSNTPSPSGEGERKPKARASRKCPDDFALTLDMLDWASQNAPGVNVQAETEKFRDHTFKDPKSDWPGTWRNWLRRAAESVGKGVGPPGRQNAPDRVSRQLETAALMTGAIRPPIRTNPTQPAEIVDAEFKLIQH